MRPGKAGPDGGESRALPRIVAPSATGFPPPRASSETFPGTRDNAGASVAVSCTTYRQSPRASTSRRITVPVMVVVTGVSSTTVPVLRVSNSAKSMPSNSSATRLHAVASRVARYQAANARPVASKNRTTRSGNEGAASSENQRIAPQPMKTGMKRKSWPNARSSARQAVIFWRTAVCGFGLSARAGRPYVATSPVRRSGDRISTVRGKLPCAVSAYPKCCFSPWPINPRRAPAAPETGLQADARDCNPFL